MNKNLHKYENLMLVNAALGAPMSPEEAKLISRILSARNSGR